MPNQRKKLLIDRSVQGSILLRMVSHWLILLVSTAGFLFFVELVISNPREAGSRFVSRHGPVALAMLVFLPIFIRDLVKLTNRFAGPIYRLSQEMRKLADGKEVSPIQLRKGDFWADVINDFNRVAERVSVVPARRLDESEATLNAAQEYAGDIHA